MKIFISQTCSCIIWCSTTWYCTVWYCIIIRAKISQKCGIQKLSGGCKSLKMAALHRPLFNVFCLFVCLVFVLFFVFVFVFLFRWFCLFVYLFVFVFSWGSKGLGFWLRGLKLDDYNKFNIYIERERARERERERDVKTCYVTCEYIELTA